MITLGMGPNQVILGQQKFFIYTQYMTYLVMQSSTLILYYDFIKFYNNGMYVFTMWAPYLVVWLLSPVAGHSGRPIMQH